VGGAHEAHRRAGHAEVLERGGTALALVAVEQALICDAGLDEREPPAEVDGVLDPAV
jgi:hypothetical protein